MPKIPNWKKRAKRNKLQTWEHEKTHDAVKLVAPSNSNVDWVVVTPYGRKLFSRKKDAKDYAVKWMRHNK